MRAAVAVAVALLLPELLGAQADRWEREVALGFGRVDSMMRLEERRPVGVLRYGALLEGEWQELHFRTEAAGRYTVVALCDGDCGGLELVVNDGSGYDLASDRAGHTVPMAEVTARAAGALRVRLGMARCGRNPCRYGIALYRRGGVSPPGSSAPSGTAPPPPPRP
jgi:hypothetical protein